MNTTRITIPWRPRIRLVFSGDAHIGNRQCNEKLLGDAVAAVASDDDAFWVELGDTIDAINWHDKRFDPNQLADWVDIGDLVDLAYAEAERFAQILKPISAKILGACRGNHEDVLSRISERDIYRELWDEVGVPIDRRLGYGGFIVLRIADIDRPKGSRRAWILTIFAHHGVGNGRLSGSKALALERLPFSFSADIYALGHSHHKMGMIKRLIAPTGTRDMAMLNVGSYLNAYSDGPDGYVERKLLYPQGVGPIEIWLYPDKREMRMVI